MGDYCYWYCIPPKWDVFFLAERSDAGSNGYLLYATPGLRLVGNVPGQVEIRDPTPSTLLSRGVRDHRFDGGNLARSW